ncbi:hypothetical protein U8C35_06585 [Sinorhizobium medicae]|uniref:hypothetical protein n=1 Tax=Sinorhizobium medicae TaxID=110321 RepID=UPI002AF6C6F5|nr:hypothetical protein [Sinorhizobium medicae]WQO60100.1 hypothetical protein U8C35_06585 [Sinorhizobium medicae]
MAEAQTLAHKKTLVVLAALALAANYLGGRFGGFPFLYCWLSPVAWQLYTAWGLFVLYGVIVFIVFHLVRQNMLMVITYSAIFMGVVESPRLLSYVLNTGGSCG